MKLKYLIVAFILLSGCENSDSTKLKELEKKVTQMENERLKAQNDSLRKASTLSIQNHEEVTQPKIVEQKRTKYCYVVIKTNEPEIVFGLKGLTDDYLKPNHFTYTSEIEEVANYTEDDKYKLMDEFEKTIRLLKFKSKDLDLASRNGHCEVVSRKCLVFESYHEASEYRSKN